MLKKFSGVFIAMLLIFFSCTDDKTGQVNRKEGMVDFAIKTSIPQGIKTYASSDGGATNVSNTNYSLRYIMEVWDGTTVAYRGYQIVDDFTKGVTFNVRLLAKDYNFVFWADFVAVNDTIHDLYYRTCTKASTNQDDFKNDSTGIGKGLKGIEMLKIDAISDDAKDAYFANRDIDLSNSDYMTTEPIILQRPFGKYRLISTDVPDGYLTGILGNVTIDYKTAMSVPEFYTKFDASTGLVDEASLSPVTGGIVAAQKENMTVPGQSDPSDVWVLAFDYVFAQVPEVVSNVTVYPTFPVAFNTTVLDAGGKQIGYREISSIPIQRNKLTTVIGNFFTNDALMDIIVSDSFVGTENVVKFNTADRQEVPDADTKTDFWIPNNTVTSTYTFDFTGPIASDKTITLRDETVGNELLNYHGKVYLEFTGTPPSISDLNINLPYATVYLNGVDITTLTASVSTNTLNIDKDCTIGTLNLTQGNAEIKGAIGTLNVAADCIAKVFGTVGTFGPVNGTVEINGAPGSYNISSSNTGTGNVFWGIDNATDFLHAIENTAGFYNTKRNDGVFLTANISGFQPTPGSSSVSVGISKNNYIIDGRTFSLSGSIAGLTGKGMLTIAGKYGITIKNITVNCSGNNNALAVTNATSGIPNYLENVTLNGTGHSGLVFTSNGGGKVIATGTFNAVGSLVYPGVDVTSGTTADKPSEFDFTGVTKTNLLKTGGQANRITTSGSYSKVDYPSWW